MERSIGPVSASYDRTMIGYRTKQIETQTECTYGHGQYIRIKPIHIRIRSEPRTITHIAPLIVLLLALVLM